MDKNITPEMVERFLNNQSDEAEAELVAVFLKNESLEALNHYLPDDDWQNNEQREHLSEELPDKMWQSVAAKTTLLKTRKIIYLKRLLIAACTVGVFFVGSYFFASRNYSKVDYSKNKVARVPKIIGNTTDMDLDTVLPDGSKMILKPGASVQYYGSFKSNRELSLTGTAYFEVVHDSEHPFVVRANGISTTDLGTKFWVLNKASNQTVTIKLIEGSIVVRSFEKSFGMKDIYLIPGQKVVVDKIGCTALVSGIEERKNVPILDVTKKAVHLGNVVWTNSAYTFSKSSLNDVFGKLERRYKVFIKVKSADIADCQFTGKIMYSDSLETLIKTICAMNSLSYTKNGDTINIKK